MNESTTLTTNPFASNALNRKKENRERLAFWVFLLMSAAMIVPLVWVFGYLIQKAWPVLSWDLVFENPTNRMRSGGLWTPIVGTFYLIFFSLIVTAPVGVLAAIYLNEYAGDNWFTRIVNLAVVNLAGVPSIVYALFGFGAFVLTLGIGKSVIAASLTLGIMNLPVIIAATKEALSAVPMAFREACWNIGATKWQAIRTVVLPNSFGGILTGVILSVSRAAGETAPIMFTGVVFYKAMEGNSIFAFSPFEQCMALSYHLYSISTQVPGVPEALPYGAAVVLIGLVVVINSSAIATRLYLRSRKRW